MESALQLRPRVTGRLARLFEDTDLLRELVGAFGSPCNVVLPDQAAANVIEFRRIYERHRLSGSIYFAHKANRSAAIVRRLATTVAGIDVASLGELQHALGAGFPPARIVATGPKATPFLWLAAATGVTVGLDSVEELQRLSELVLKHGLEPVPVLVRLSGFTSNGVAVTSRPSRFGIATDDLGMALDALDRNRDVVRVVGVAYHLDTIGSSEKAVALDSCLRALDACRERGHTGARAIDVGGGFGVDYLERAQDWEEWTSALTGAVLGHRPPITWGGHSYGLRADHGHLRGSLALYPAHRPLSGPAYLDDLLARKSPSTGRTFATSLLEQLNDLHIEPGRALLDQCGLVLVRVGEVRRGAGRTLVTTEANARDVSIEEHRVLMDPVVIPGDRRRLDDQLMGVQLLGNLCLEADLLTRRVVWLPACLRPGDLLAFANTAGYFMDFNADHALQQPTAETVAAYQVDGEWRWCLDGQYWPTMTGEVAT